MTTLNLYYEISVLLEFHALGDVLDIVSCYNVENLPLINVPISQRMTNIFERTILEDIP